MARDLWKATIICQKKRNHLLRGWKQKFIKFRLREENKQTHYEGVNLSGKSKISIVSKKNHIRLVPDQNPSSELFMGSITCTDPSNASLDQNPLGNSKKTKESDQHVDSIESDDLVIDEDNFGQYMNSVFRNDVGGQSIRNSNVDPRDSFFPPPSENMRIDLTRCSQCHFVFTCCCIFECSFYLMEFMSFLIKDKFCSSKLEFRYASDNI
ncbi:unnamed protein product [Moneuplotes crassus]|uniref:Uncharacterized protein n=1 Tax=Euplotes crassus TaxID=5936 RepID=A0AAD2D1J1_EUPCR|nr:unnamed protein product [Moneuplotes crassus]